jgi:hypothetical protein
MSVAETAKACAAYRNHAARLGTVCRQVSRVKVKKNLAVVGYNFYEAHLTISARP